MKTVTVPVYKSTDTLEIAKVPPVESDVGVKLTRSAVQARTHFAVGVDVVIETTFYVAPRADDEHNVPPPAPVRLRDASHPMVQRT